MTNRYLARLLTGTTLLSSTAVLALAAGSAPAAFAAASCAPSDPFHVKTLTAATAVASGTFGFPVATGDFNGDGFDDAAIGSGRDLAGSVAGGSVSVYLGSATGLGEPRRITQANVTGEIVEAEDRFGAALVAGDFTGDGKDDLAIGSPGEGAGAGIVALFLGNATGLSASGGVISQALAGGVAESADRFGASLAAGDFNGDGKDDLAMSAPDEAPAGKTVRSGEVYVMTGMPTGVQRAWIIQQAAVGQTEQAGDQFGVSMAAGQVIGDAKDDLVVGARNRDIGTDVDTGVIFVLPGAGNKPASGGFVRGQGGSADESGDRFGSALAIADFNKDGKNDIAVGVPFETWEAGVRRGNVQVLTGPVAAGSASYGVAPMDASDTVYTEDIWGNVLTAGDVDGDTFADLLVGATGSNRVGVFAGNATGPVRPERTITQGDLGGTEAAGEQFGGSLALGDFDNDGNTDALIGSHGEPRNGVSGAGVAYVLDDPLSSTSHDIEQYAPTAALQSAQVGTADAPIRYAYTDNVGGPRILTQTDPGSTGSMHRAADGPGDAVLTGKPVIGQTADGKGVVAFRSVTGGLWMRTEATAGGTAWGPWANYGGPDLSGISMATLANGRLAVFGVAAGGELAVLEQLANGKFGAWQGTGIGGLTGDPLTVSLSSGIRVFARDADGNVQTALWSGSRLTGCATLGDRTIVGSPAAVVLPGSRLRVFATTPDQQLVTIGQDATGAFQPTWSTVRAEGIDGPPAAVFDRLSARITVMARGTDQFIWGATETQQGSATFGEWRSISATESFTGVTAVPFTASGRDSYYFVYRDVNNQENVMIPNGVQSFRERKLPKS